MKIQVVFESMFGNTEAFARQVAAGLAAAREGADRVVLADVRDLAAADLHGTDLLVVGAPTHAFSLSRPGTRADAVRQGADPARATLGAREWLAVLDEAFPSGVARPPVAVFDTRVSQVRRLPGSAARRAARLLRAKGFTVLDEPTSFYVGDVKGPPAPGEGDRAAAWGRRLAALAGTGRRVS